MVRRRAESEGGMSEKKDELVLGFYRDENGDVSFSGAEMLDAKGWLAVMASATRFLGIGFHALQQDLPRVKVDWYSKNALPKPIKHDIFLRFFFNDVS